jgi:hypothetical protein
MMAVKPKTANFINDFRTKSLPLPRQIMEAGMFSCVASIAAKQVIPSIRQISVMESGRV